MNAIRQPRLSPAMACVLYGCAASFSLAPAQRAMGQERPEPALVDAKPSSAAETSGLKSPPPKLARPSAAGEPPEGAEAMIRVSIARPEMDPAQRKDWAERLRKLYNQEPTRWPPPTVDPSVQWTELGLLPDVVHPAENPASPDKIRLGELLFFDPRLSGSGQMACATCHDPDLGWADGRRVAIGDRRKQLKRNTPAILTAGFGSLYFWDGRAASLEDQAAQVLNNPDEMNSSAAHVEEQVSRVAEYRARFAAAFGDDTVTLERVCQAIACFERSLTRGRSRFDSFVRGRHDLLSDEALIGLHLFRTEARCMNCHHGPNFSDGEFHDLGLSYYGRMLEDLGRHGVTQAQGDVGRFKTPSLRNVANTGPYMHNGVFPLRGVLNLYNAGMPTLRRQPRQQDDPLFPTKSPLLARLSLNRQDLDALEAFLESLSEPTRRLRLPTLPGLEAVPATEH